MSTRSSCFKKIEQLRDYVYKILCDQENLEPGIFSMTERIILQAGEPCGIYFCLHGPRSVKCTAIWETVTNTILFYGATGQRFLKTQLTSAPAVRTAA